MPYTVVLCVTMAYGWKDWYKVGIVLWKSFPTYVMVMIPKCLKSEHHTNLRVLTRLKIAFIALVEIRAVFLP